MKKERGITLIALVITIIVLLILAGVSISLVVGNNGVLTQATGAVEKNREATAIEDVQMAWASAKTQYLNDWASDASKNINDYLTKAKLDTYLEDKGHLEGEPKFDETTKVYTVNYRAKDQNELYTFLVTMDGKVSKKTGIILSDSEAHIIAGSIKTLTAKFVDMQEGTITWTSSDTTGKIVVSNLGEISVAEGTVPGSTATITATCNGKNSTCEVTVVEILANINDLIGKYIDINVGYIDAYASGRDYTGANQLKAWRVLSVDTSTGVVRLISTGHPFEFHIGNLATSSTEIKTVQNGEVNIIERSPSIAGYVESGFTPSNMSGIFSNTSIFSGIDIPNKDDFSSISNDDDLRKTGYCYGIMNYNSLERN